jgi:phosphoribosylanthranilate isomerase
MLIKVCGLRQKDNILIINALQIDYFGLIFYEKSLRFVPDSAATELLALQLPFVGVFVNENIATIVSKVTKFGLVAVQLHGNEDVDFIIALKKAFVEKKLHNIKIFKAFGVSQNTDFQEFMKYESYCDLFIFDTKTPLHGGSGQQYDWSILSNYKGKTPFLLSGGISASDAHRIRNFQHPQFAGVDLNSRFEISAALKDVGLLEDFLCKINLK